MGTEGRTSAGAKDARLQEIAGELRDIATRIERFARLGDVFPPGLAEASMLRRAAADLGVAESASSGGESVGP